MGMQNLEVDGERPINPPKIISTKVYKLINHIYIILCKVLINPFDDIAAREGRTKKVTQTKQNNENIKQKSIDTLDANKSVKRKPIK